MLFSSFLSSFLPLSHAYPHPSFLPLSGNKDRYLFLFFRDELKLANAKKSATVCKKNGVISPNDFAG